MLIRRCLLCILSLVLLASVCDAVIGGVVVGYIVGEEILKKIAEKVLVNAGAKLGDTALAAIFIAAGMKNTTEQKIDQLWAEIGKSRFEILSAIKDHEAKSAARVFNTNVADKIRTMYELMNRILQGNGTAVQATATFLKIYDDESPFHLAVKTLVHLKDEDNNFIRAKINADVQFGGSRELIVAILRNLQTLLDQIKAISVFHYGLDDTNDVIAWINKESEGHDATDPNFIIEITEKYLGHFESIRLNKPIAEVFEEVTIISKWIIDYVDNFENNNPYWEHGIVESLLQPLVDRLTKKPKLFKGLRALANEASALLYNVTTTDKLDVLAIYNSHVNVYRNKSGSVKRFRYTGGDDETFFGYELVVFRTMANVVVSEAQNADMKSYSMEQYTKSDVMDRIQNRNDTLNSIVVVCTLHKGFYPVVWTKIHGDNATHPVQGTPNWWAGCARSGQIYNSTLYLSVG